MSARGSLLKRTLRVIRRLNGDTRAATAVEYGLIVTLIVIASIAAFIQLAGATSGMWNNVNHEVTAAH